MRGITSRTSCKCRNCYGVEYLLEVKGVEPLGFKQGIDSTLFLFSNFKDKAMQEAPHIGKLIKEELARQGRSVRWLAEQVGCTRQNMHYLLGRSFIYTDVLLKISDALDCDFFKYFTDCWKARKVSKDI